jgi:REP element-mobilizing transposase RayT
MEAEKPCIGLPKGGSELARDLRQRPRVGYAALRRYRWSTPYLTYFATFCTVGRKRGLQASVLVNALNHQRAAMAQEGVWLVRAQVIMPDHVHMLFQLGEPLSLGKAMARLKAKTTPALRNLGLNWQAGYFERRLREADSVTSVIYYLLMNPVRAGLVSRGEDWPGFYCSDEDWRRFAEYAHEASAGLDWLEVAKGAATRKVASKLAPTRRA